MTRTRRLTIAALAVVVAAGIGWWAGVLAAPAIGRWEIATIERQMSPPPRPELPGSPFGR